MEDDSTAKTEIKNLTVCNVVKDEQDLSSAMTLTLIGQCLMLNYHVA